VTLLLAAFAFLLYQYRQQVTQKCLRTAQEVLKHGLSTTVDFAAGGGVVNFQEWAQNRFAALTGQGPQAQDAGSKNAASKVGVDARSSPVGKGKDRDVEVGEILERKSNEC